jgi:hypothetical protein
MEVSQMTQDLPDENRDELSGDDDVDIAAEQQQADTESEFVPEPTAHEREGPPSDAADLPTSTVNPQNAAASGDGGKELSEAEINELIQRIADEVAARQASSGRLSPERLEGIALHVVEKASSDSARDGNGGAKPSGAEAERGPSAPPRQQDDSSGAVERFAGGIFQRPEPAAPTANAEKLAAVPPIIVMVQLADARAILEDERRATAKENAAMLEQIADERIKLASWRQENQRRAADFRLRGPSW